MDGHGPCGSKPSSRTSVDISDVLKKEALKKIGGGGRLRGTLDVRQFSERVRRVRLAMCSLKRKAGRRPSKEGVLILSR
jgi:hypothetical protein